jgi:hypothetical protein
MQKSKYNISEVQKWFDQKNDQDLVWRRPSDWIALPAVNVGDEKFVGLFAVYDTAGSNTVAVQCKAAYNVDWGDGTSSLNVTTDTVAEHSYNYADLGAGTLCSRGYRQAIITITPYGAGHLTMIRLDNRHSTIAQANTAPWLEIKVAGSFIDSHRMYIGGYVWLRLLESYEFVGTNAIANFNSCFYNCHSLQRIIHYTNAGTNFASMFNSCYNLKQAPKINPGGAADISGMFYKCYNLVDVPILDTHTATTYQNMFYQCQRLQSIPLFNSTNVTNWQGMFYQCQALEEVPMLDTAAATNVSGMFQGCFALRKVPLLNTANCLNFSSMFYNCYSLIEVPLFNTIKGTDFSSMFYGCAALLTIPQFNTAKGTTFGSMFIYCASLREIPLLDTHLGVTFSNMFSNCLSLILLPLLDVSAGTVFTTIFSTTQSVQKGALSGTTRSISYLNCKMSHDELVSVIANIGVAAGAQTLTLTGNPGTASLTAGEQAVATGKGWTLAL